MIRLLFSLFRRVSKVQAAQLLKVGVATLALIVFSSSGFMFFELASKPDLKWADAIWWSIVTMTTVGYGDHFPTTMGGRYLIGIPTMIFGISILGYLLSTVATFLIEARSKELKGMAELSLSDHLLLIHYPGAPRMRKLVTDLRADDKTAETTLVLVDDRLEEVPPEAAEAGVKFVRGSPTKEQTLERACFRDARGAVILARDLMDTDSDDYNLAAVLTIEKTFPALHTVAECIDPERVDLLYKAGCDSVVCLAKLSSNLLAQEVLDPGVQLVLQEITDNTFGQQIYIVPIERLESWTYGELADHVRANGALIMGLEREKKVLVNPARDEKVSREDKVVCICANRPDPIAV